jgi:hypothetical protein
VLTRLLGIFEDSVKVYLAVLFSKTRGSRRELIAERGFSVS